MREYVHACIHVCTLHKYLSLSIWVYVHINKHLPTHPHVFSVISKTGLKMFFMQYFDHVPFPPPTPPRCSHLPTQPTLHSFSLAKQNEIKQKTKPTKMQIRKKTRKIPIRQKKLPK